MKSLIHLLLLGISAVSLIAQTETSPCSHKSILARHLADYPDAVQEMEQTEKMLNKIIVEHKKTSQNRAPITFTIPVVMHVFHDGENGKMDMNQALSGLEIMNQDFNGLNDGWEDIIPQFDSIKGSMPINFCLATIDPYGNPTTGVNYYQDPQGMLNEGDLFRVAWDNTKYFNIYFPKYTGGEPSDFTAYAYYPSNSRVRNNEDGVFIVLYDGATVIIRNWKRATTGPLYVPMKQAIG